jgi:phenylalanyl-tRNA synthetase beta chain
MALRSRRAIHSPPPPPPPPVLSAPHSEDFQIGRTTIVPGLLKTLASNRAVSVRAGVRLFEVSDVMLLDGASDVGARNERHAAVVYTGPTAGFEVVHGIVDRLFALLEIPARPFSWESAGAGGASAAANFGKHGLRYAIEPTDEIASFFPGRGARVVLETAAGARTDVGSLGVLHPHVLANFELSFPASVLEINIEPLV